MYRLRCFRTLSATVGFASLLLVAGLVQAETSTPWPEIPLPPHAKVEWIAASMRVNGIPMRVMRFESTVSRSEIIAYYTAHWTGGYQTKPTVTQLGAATVVGQAHGPYYMTVKVGDRAHQGSGGLIAVSQILGSRIQLAAGGLPMMPGAKIISVVESKDPGKICRELLIRQDTGADAAMKYYEAALVNAGWHQIQNTLTTPSGSAQYGSLAIFQRDQSQLSISAAQVRGQRGSSILANLVTKDTGLSAE